MSDRSALIAVAAFALSLVGACGSTPSTAPSAVAPSPSPDGLSQARAVELATGAAAPHRGPLTVEAVRSGTFAELGGGVSLRGVGGDQRVWSVTFRGEFADACPSPGPTSPAGPTPPSCLSPALTHDTVVIDSRDGRLLISSLGP